MGRASQRDACPFFSHFGYDLASIKLGGGPNVFRGNKIFTSKTTEEIFRDFIWGSIHPAPHPITQHFDTKYIIVFFIPAKPPFTV